MPLPMWVRRHGPLRWGILIWIWTMETAMRTFILVDIGKVFRTLESWNTCGQVANMNLKHFYFKLAWTQVSYFFFVYTCAFIFHELVGKYMQYGTTVYTSTVHTNIEHMNEIWCWKQDIMVTWNLFQPVCGPDCFEPFLYPPSVRGWMGCWFWGLFSDGSRSCQEDKFCGFCGAIPQWVWIQVDKLE